jgi:iron complex outermembrane receptor protein
MRHRYLLFLFAAFPLNADQVINLNPYVVVAPNLGTVEEVLPQASIREAKPIDLASILSNELSGIALSRKSPLAGDIVMRGMTRDNVLITVDGTQTHCACPNRMDPPAFHVSSQQIESISIRTGPFTVRQGGTTGGAVLVRTSGTPSATEARAHLYTGDFGYLAGGLSVGTPMGSGDWQAQLGIYGQRGNVYRDGDGLLFTNLPGTNYRPEYMDTRAFEVINLEGKVGVSLNNGLSLSLGYALQDARDVLYPGLKMDAMTDTMHRGSLSLAGKVASDIMDSWQLSFTMSQVDHDMLDTFRMSSRMKPMFIERGYMMRTTAETAHYRLAWEAVKRIDKGAISYGLDVARREWDADNVIMMLQNDMLPDVRGMTWGIWGVYEHSTDRIKLEAGARINSASTEARQDISHVQAWQETDTNKNNDILPAAYMLADFSLSENTSLFAGIGHGTRLPDPQERYINLDRPTGKPDWVGNPDLRPVKNTEFQTGFRHQAGRLNITGSLFHSWLNDYIYLDSIMNSAGKATTYTNIDARLYGASFKWVYQIDGHWILQGNIAWQEGTKSGTHGYSNDTLAEVPPMRAITSLQWDSGNLLLKASIVHQSDLERIDPYLNEQEIDGSTVVNLYGSWQFNDHLNLSAGIDNLFEETYAVANAFVRDPFANSVVVNEPGRFMYARISVSY